MSIWRRRAGAVLQKRPLTPAVLAYRIKLARLAQTSPDRDMIARNNPKKQSLRSDVPAGRESPQIYSAVHVAAAYGGAYGQRITNAGHGP